MNNKLLNKKRKLESDDDLSESLEEVSQCESSQESPKVSKKETKIKTSDKHTANNDINIGKDEITITVKMFLIKLNQKKKVSIRKFKGQTLIDIREYFSTDKGEIRPTKKGVSLTVELWKKLKNHIDDIDEAIKNI